jgi:uncharacterized protein
MQCPLCNVALVMTERAGVEIDYCPGCRGVWLDRGELDKIIERSEGVAAMPAAGSPVGGRLGKHDHESRIGHDGRRKSFWREIFD